MMTNKERARGNLSLSEATVFDAEGRKLYRQSRGCDFLMEGGVPFEVKHNIFTGFQSEDMIRAFDRGMNPVLAVVDDDGTKLLTFRLETVEEIDMDRIRKKVYEMSDDGTTVNEIGMTIHYSMTKIRMMLRDRPKA
jgi:hypothetical protein